MSNELTLFTNKAVERRREIAGVPAIMGVLSAQEKSAYLASIGKTFAEYDEMELSAAIKESLPFILKDMGIRPMGVDDFAYLVVRVRESLQRYFSGMTLKDFRMAFDMTLAGALDDYYPKRADGQADRQHYQMFNAEYVCKVLNAYKAYRAAVIRKVNEAVPAPEQGRDYESEKEVRAEIVNDLLAAYESYCDTGRFPNVSPVAEMLYYKYLADAGLAPAFEVSELERAEVLKGQIAFYTMKGMTGDANRLKTEGTRSEELRYGAFVLARRKALKTAFARMREDGINIREHIKG